MRHRATWLLTTGLWALQAAAASAQVTLVPPDLSPGGEYHLVFVTSTTHSALETDIAFYDGFIQALADAEGIGAGSPIGDISWRVIGSTPFDSALSHVGSSAQPIYRLDGVRVANGTADLWDGALEVPIDVDEEGVTRHVLIHTGTDIDGMPASVGATPVVLGSAGVQQGSSGASDEDWTDIGSFSPATTGRAYYGISGLLVVPGEPGGGGSGAQVPALSPGSRWLLAALLAALLAVFLATRAGVVLRGGAPRG